MATIDRVKLAILKAYLLGRAVAERHGSKGEILRLTQAAIDQLSTSGSDEQNIQLLFYTLLKCELLRESPDIVSCRAQAKSVAYQIGEEVFDNYMAVQDATQTKKAAYGMQQGIIADSGVQTYEEYGVSDGHHVWIVRKNVALEALNIDEKDLSESEMRFLHEVPLYKILEKHGIEVAP